jgi:hypothetical protein
MWTFGGYEQMEKAKNFDEIERIFETEPLEDSALDAFYYPETMQIRMGEGHLSPIEDLFDTCTRYSSKMAHLFLGHQGCGKSTELNKLIEIYQGHADGEVIEDREFLLAQLESSVVFEYNGNRWHALHPLVAEFLKEKGFVDEHSEKQ